MSKKMQAPSVEAHTAAEHVAGVKDVMLQILIRLPAKPLTRFKLVSKQWLSLISDPQFLQSHIQRNNSPSGMFITLPKSYGFFPLESNQSQPIPSLSFLDGVLGDGYEVKILESRKGLLLCRFMASPPYSDTVIDNLCVCNPTTNQHKLLPRPFSVSESGWTVCGLYFVFDPSISLHYKIVCVKYKTSNSSAEVSFEVLVYSSETLRWRTCLQFQTLDAYPIKHKKGGIIWIGNKAFDFDFDSETLVEMPPVPRAVNGVVSDKVFGLMNGYVCLFCGSLPNDNLYVLGMSRDDGKWVVKYSGSFSHLTSVYPEIVETMGCYEQDQVKIFNFNVLDVIEGLQSNESVLVLAIPGRIISYNFMTKTVMVVYDLPMEVYEKLHFSMYLFTETLASV